MSRPAADERPLLSALTACARVHQSHPLYYVAHSHLAGLIEAHGTAVRVAQRLHTTERTVRRLAVAYDLRFAHRGAK